MNDHDYILETLCQELHCSYLSDLKSHVYRAMLRSYVLHKDMSPHALEAWDYAYAYILGQPSGAISLAEMKEQFIQNL